MRDNRQSIDVIVHSEDGVSLSLAATRIEQNVLQIVGSLTDPQVPARVDVRISSTLSTELVDGAHVERERAWRLDIDGEETEVSWVVRSIELDDSYRLHDVRATGDSVSLRAFGIEDLAATVGVGIAAGVAAYFVWRSHRRDKQAVRIQAEAIEARDRQVRECYEHGGFPTVECDISDEAGLTERGLKIKSAYRYKVRCDHVPR